MQDEELEHSEHCEYFVYRQVDLVVEVAHPDITVQYGADILQFCDYMVCTCFNQLHCYCRLVLKLKICSKM